VVKERDLLKEETAKVRSHELVMVPIDDLP